MKIKNNSIRAYMAFDIIIKPGEELEIEDEKTLSLLLKQEGIEEVADVAKLKEELELAELKAKALELGIKPGNMKANTLKKKIEEALSSQ